jgi:sugar phosphate permease|tara:strand:+ start:495 stop:1796 length:1302 start_codon:yes stop_codon:yes gene_type:complete
MNNGSRNLYYGWFVLAVCFFIALSAFGIRSSMGVFVTPLEADMGWSRADITRVLSLGILVGAVSFLVTGYLHDRFGGRLVIGGALIMLGVCTALMSTVNSIPSFIFIYGFLGSFASSGVSFVTIHSLLARWFFKRRGLVMSISAAGGSFGPLMFAPLSAYLIQTFDWRFAFIVLGCIIAFIAGPMALAFLKDSPSSLLPKSEKVVEEDVDEGKTTTLDGPLFTSGRGGWKQALSTSPFWQLSAAYLVCGITTNILSVHFVPFAEDQGVPKMTAASIFGVMMGLNSIGVLTAGMLSNWWSQKLVLGSTYALRGVAYAVLLTVGGVEGMWAFAFIAGMSWIATASMTSSLTADIFGLRNLGTLNGMTNMSHQIGGALSVLMAGELQQLTGSYVIPFAIAGLTLIGASIAAFSVNEKKYSYRYSTVGTVPQPGPAS